MRRIMIAFIGLMGTSILLIYPIYGLYHQYHARQEVLATYNMYEQLSDQEINGLNMYWEEISQTSELRDPFNPISQKERSIRTETQLISHSLNPAPKHFIDLQEDAIGIIRMPSIKEQALPIYMDATKDHLKKGIGHVSGTDIPLAGSGTHTVLSGHRGYYGANLFLYIDYLVPGDMIYVNYLGSEAAYRVMGNEIVSAQDIDKLTMKPDDDQEWLTLLTCHPIPTFQDRLLVHAVRVPDAWMTSYTVTHISDKEWIALSDQMNESVIEKKDQDHTPFTVGIMPKKGILAFVVSSLLQDPTLLYIMILIIIGILWIRYGYLWVRNIIALIKS